MKETPRPSETAQWAYGPTSEDRATVQSEPIAEIEILVLRPRGGASQKWKKEDLQKCSLDDILNVTREFLELQMLGTMQPQEESRQLWPNPGSKEVSDMIDKVLEEYQYPTNPKNAARAGFVAAARLMYGRFENPFQVPEKAAPQKEAPSEDWLKVMDRLYHAIVRVDRERTRVLDLGACFHPGKIPHLLYDLQVAYGYADTLVQKQQGTEVYWLKPMQTLYWAAKELSESVRLIDFDKILREADHCMGEEKKRRLY